MMFRSAASATPSPSVPTRLNLAPRPMATPSDGQREVVGMVDRFQRPPTARVEPDLGREVAEPRREGQDPEGLRRDRVEAADSDDVQRPAERRGAGDFQPVELAVVGPSQLDGQGAGRRLRVVAGDGEDAVGPPGRTVPALRISAAIVPSPARSPPRRSTRPAASSAPPASAVRPPVCI